MSNEKKMGLAFLGILVVAFCGVLTMRLMGDPMNDDKVEVNIGGPTAAAGPAASGSNSTATAKTAAAPVSDRAATPPSPFQRPDAAKALGNDATAARTPAPPPAYLPPPAAMRPAAESATPPPFSGSAVRAPAPSSDPFSRGPAAAPASAPAAGLASAASPPATALPPSPYGSGAPIAPTAAAASPPAGGASMSPPVAAPAVPGAFPEPPAAPLTAGNPLRGSTTTPDLRSPGVAALSGPSGASGFEAAAPSQLASSSPAAAPAAVSAPMNFTAPSAVAVPAATTEPTLPTGGAQFGSPTGRNTTAAAPPASPSVAGDGRFAPSGRDIAVTSASLPAPSQDKPYVVATDDSFWSISEKVYGSGAYYRALFQYNRDRYPNADAIRPGSVLDVPPLEVLKQKFPELVDGSATASTTAPATAAPATPATYIVREGETLSQIAREQLGKATRWTELYELNRDVLGEKLENLRAGLELRLK
jgi:nucleoid-associated protein YgaU